MKSHVLNGWAFALVLTAVSLTTVGRANCEDVVPGGKRAWTNANGQRIVATFVRSDDTHVWLQKSGVTKAFAKAHLSSADRDRIAAFERNPVGVTSKFDETQSARQRRARITAAQRRQREAASLARANQLVAAYNFYKSPVWNAQVLIPEILAHHPQAGWHVAGHRANITRVIAVRNAHDGAVRSTATQAVYRTPVVKGWSLARAGWMP